MVTDNIYSLKTVIEINSLHEKHFYNFNSLKEALDKQIANKYLKHQNCKIGFLLLINNSNKKYEFDNKNMDYDNLLSKLKSYANELANKKDILLQVYSLDIRKSINKV